MSDYLPIGYDSHAAPIYAHQVDAVCESCGRPWQSANSARACCSPEYDRAYDDD